MNSNMIPKLINSPSFDLKILPKVGEYLDHYDVYRFGVEVKKDLEAKKLKVIAVKVFQAILKQHRQDFVALKSQLEKWNITYPTFSVATQKLCAVWMHAQDKSAFWAQTAREVIEEPILPMINNLELRTLRAKREALSQEEREKFDSQLKENTYVIAKHMEGVALANKKASAEYFTLLVDCVKKMHSEAYSVIYSDHVNIQNLFSEKKPIQLITSGVEKHLCIRMTKEGKQRILQIKLENQFFSTWTFSYHHKAEQFHEETFVNTTSLTLDVVGDISMGGESKIVNAKAYKSTLSLIHNGQKDGWHIDENRSVEHDLF